MNKVFKYFLIGISLVLVISFAWYKIYFVSSNLVPNQILVQNLQEEKVDLSKYKGKPMVVNFWGTWCAPCRKEFPFFQNELEKYGDKINFIMISDETIDKIREYKEKNAYGFTYLQTDMDFKKYGIRFRPTTYFYNSSGYLVKKHTGGIKKGEVLSKILADLN